MSDVDQLEFLESKTKRGRKGLSPGSLVLLAGMLAVAMVLGVQLSRQNSAQPTSGPAPDFKLALFDGGEFKLSDQLGQVVLINFWASWCPPCRDEAPDLQTLYSEYGDSGFTIIGVNMLESSQQKALDFIGEFAITYPNGEDTGQKVTNLYRVEAPPESFLIDRHGVVRQFIIGGVSYDALSAQVIALLAEPG